MSFILKSFIPHGVDEVFREVQSMCPWPEDEERPISCIYVSNMDMYKHQVQVIEAISTLRTRGHKITLKLVGGGTSAAEKLVKNAIENSHQKGSFVERVEFVAHKEIPALLSESDVFIFASSFLYCSLPSYVFLCLLMCAYIYYMFLYVFMISYIF